jgi:hypothetical protein
MEFTKNAIDSEILGHPVLEITDFDSTLDFERFEAYYLEREAPLYVICKVPAENMEDIHALEAHGFRFVEFQMRLRGSLQKLYDTTGYPYTYLPVTSPEDRESVLALAASIFENDRVSRDPFFQQWPDRNISGERYRRYVMRSFEAPDEFVYKLTDTATGEVVGFSTHRILTPDTALLLVGGVIKAARSAGVGVINDYFGLNELKRKGVKSFRTHVSGSNYPILNLEIRGLGFRIIQSFVVLRKIYSGQR